MRRRITPADGALLPHHFTLTSAYAKASADKPTHLGLARRSLLFLHSINEGVDGAVFFLLHFPYKRYMAAYPRSIYA